MPTMEKAALLHEYGGIVVGLKVGKLVFALPDLSLATSKEGIRPLRAMLFYVLFVSPRFFFFE